MDLNIRTIFHSPLKWIMNYFYNSNYYKLKMNKIANVVSKMFIVIFKGNFRLLTHISVLI